MSMRGIDISTYQRGLYLGNIDFDFAIIKATEGTRLVQDTCDPWVQHCRKAGKRWGFYHFLDAGDPVAQADFFVAHTKNYFREGLACVDYEQYGMTGAANVKKFMDRVHELTGVWCVLYMSRSVIGADDWSAIAPTCPLWVAQYANDGIVNGHQSDPWIQDGGFGPWASPIIHQYTSHGRLDGWGKNLDLDKAYITAEEWDALAAGGKEQDKPATEDKPQTSTPSTGGGGTQKTYTVKAGDSWWLIAEKQMGSGSKMHELAAANGKTINDVIHPGDVLKIPGGTSKPSTGGGTTQKTYTVKAGDSWWLIAEKQMGSGSKMHELAAANGKTINDVIHPGDVLKIPGGTSKPSTGGGSGGNIVKGSKVKVKQGAKDYNGGGLASFVYSRTHVVSEVSGDRCVITYNGAVVAAVRKSDLTLVSGGSSGGSSSTSKPSSSTTKAVQKGSKVKVKQGAKDYNGGGLASFVYTRTHVVSEMSGNRCVITYNGVVVAAVHKDNLTVV